MATIKTIRTLALALGLLSLTLGSTPTFASPLSPATPHHALAETVKQGTFTLKIVPAKHQPPIAGAQVFLQGEGRKPLLVGQVEKNNVFQSLVEPGTYVVRVQAPGYAEYSTKVEIKATTQTLLAISLTPAEVLGGR